MKVTTKTLSEEETVYIYENKTGTAQMHLHQVFPGIELAYHTVHMDRRKLEAPEKDTIIEIRHCQQGRIEQHFRGGFFYLKPGDLSVTVRKEEELELKFPQCHYHGITIRIHTGIAPKCVSCFLKDVNVSPLLVAERLCGGKGSFVVRKKPYVEHIFDELYSIPEQYKKGFLKIKILELLLVLSGIDPEENKVSAVSLSQTQVELAGKAAAYLKNRTDRECTVTELAETFGISKSHLQNAFRGVYGLSVYEYIRAQKMQQAAFELAETEKSILTIANEYGYENGSKFAAAFRKVMGETPTGYRRRSRINGERNIDK